MNEAGEQTQWRPASFTFQTSKRDAERTMIHNAYSFVKQHCPKDTRNLYNYATRDMDEFKSGEVSEGVTAVGRYRMSSTPITVGVTCREVSGRCPRGGSLV